jgi:hypothetical protein
LISSDNPKTGQDKPQQDTTDRIRQAGWEKQPRQTHSQTKFKTECLLVPVLTQTKRRGTQNTRKIVFFHERNAGGEHRVGELLLQQCFDGGETGLK